MVLGKLQKLEIEVRNCNIHLFCFARLVKKEKKEKEPKIKTNW